MTTEEYTAVQNYILSGAQFFEPEIVPEKQEPKELLQRLVNVPDDIQRNVIHKAGADMKAFEHVNYCLAVRKNLSAKPGLLLPVLDKMGSCRHNTQKGIRIHAKGGVLDFHQDWHAQNISKEQQYERD